MASNFYESNNALSEYLLFHYGEPHQVLPYSFGPAAALHYPVRCVTECLDVSILPECARALDVGCAVGRSSFELARFCSEVIGIDYSNSFIDAANRLKQNGHLTFEFREEGDLTVDATAGVPPDIDRSRVTFMQGDAQALPANLGGFDVVLAANLIDRLPNPRLFLDAFPQLVRRGGQLILTSPYTWMEEYTPRENWLGGFARDGQPVRTLDGLKAALDADFKLARRLDLPFLIREHARKYQWSVAEGTVWLKR